MLKLNPQLLADPIVLVAAFIAVAAIAILVWAALNWKKLNMTHSENDELSSYDEINAAEPQPSRNMESSGVFEAQLQEITGQLSEISSRLCTMEKNVPPPADADKTMTLSIPPDINIKLQNIEARLDGIHKLLIILTDSGEPK
jgi:hypothetical protein